MSDQQYCVGFLTPFGMAIIQDGDEIYSRFGILFLTVISP
jgi:hypothetical protein